jgi:hypothetical protein
MGGIQNELRERAYEADAIVPRFSWIRAGRILSPKVRITREGQLVRAAWNERGKRKAFWFVVYARDKNGWSISVLPAGEKSISLSSERNIEQIVVTSVDRLGNESEPPA